jgi:hypothetical protein
MSIKRMMQSRWPKQTGGDTVAMEDTVSCPITGDAVITSDDAAPDGMRWKQADPEIHVAAHLLNELLDDIDTRAKAFLLATYEIGEHCPHNPNTIHARRKDTTNATT